MFLLGDNMVFRELYLYYTRQAYDQLNSTQYKKIVFVTDLIYCPNKYHLRYKYPEMYITLWYTPRIVIGTLLHEAIANIIKKAYPSNYEVEYEVEKPVELVIDDLDVLLKGRIDLVDNNNRVIYELKFSSYDDHIPDHYKLQVNIYQTILFKLTGKVYHGKIVVFNKNKIVEHDVEYNEIDLVKLVKAVIENDQELIPRYGSFNSFMLIHEFKKLWNEGKIPLSTLLC